jgi:hypothetical protein
MRQDHGIDWALLPGTPLGRRGGEQARHGLYSYYIDTRFVQDRFGWADRWDREQRREWRLAQTWTNLDAFAPQIGQDSGGSPNSMCPHTGHR